MNRIHQRPIYRFANGRFEQKQDVVATEYPITVKLNGKELLTIVCTPEYIEDMVVGFLASERIIVNYDDIKDIRLEEELGFISIESNKTFPFFEQLQNKRYITSCCGMSRQGFVFANDALTAKRMIEKNVHLTPEECISLMENMDTQADLFQQTGGVHIAALCDKNNLMLTRMDIGRHNALDKIYGYCLRNNISVKDKVIVFSGRISSEILLKVSKIGCEIVLSKSAPTHLAINLADELGITAVGFIRGQSFNVYTHPERIIH
ncbi:formate dehydrogenase accessory sulfurtransferase FdhD [Sporosarcina thermotolerans]|uniref:Sulfur carrier protein FdhD n=1 Tax=Sporosarcina thermotolerans TaxID=633404 RepID=A0AAW9ADM7_9BACL|nr:formate dehydrogenase accessory sulfurtransferase FdhD [Sporosarcina thermotolerans]MDW0117243.1 formate dehydrogenase accessory sulfurtransferase FdhD [Sporosarcina thermotolerans]